MTEIVVAARDIQTFIASKGWDFCFIGGVAVMRWGELRVTQDVDLTVYTGFQNEDEIIDTFVSAFRSRIPDASIFALEKRVLLLLTGSGIPFDVSLGGLPFEERMIHRSTMFEFIPGAALRTCSAEDLVILKAFAGRAIDWMDIEGVLIKQGGTLDWEMIHEELTPLSEWKEDPSILPRLEQLRQKFAT